MLEEQLDCDAEGEGVGDAGRQAEQDQGRDSGGGFDGLVEGVFHQSVEAVGAFDAVVHGVKPPQGGDFVAGQVHQGDAEVGHEHRDEHLHEERPVMGPDAVDRGDGGENRQGGDATEGDGFVDRGVEGVASAVVV